MLRVETNQSETQFLSLLPDSPNRSRTFELPVSDSLTVIADDCMSFHPFHALSRNNILVRNSTCESVCPPLARQIPEMIVKLQSTSSKFNFLLL